jgi:dTDP-4-dehydrorhamnose 3,5-epimerase
MIFTETKLRGAFVIEPERIEDERGFFARTFCEDEFNAHGLEGRFVQCSVSFNRHKGTLRGLHYQAQPHEEAKIVRCTRGAIFDVAVDLRPSSSTFGRWTSAELTADNGCALYLPKGFAHGFQTLSNDAEVYYEISARYLSESARGIRWDDPELSIGWPVPIPILSVRDRQLSTLRDFQRGI